MTSNLQDLEDLARTNLPLAHYDFFAGGAQDEVTLWENRSAFERIFFQPRVLKGKIDNNTSCDLLGNRLRSPIILSPTAFHQLAHPEGELASAKAANAFGTVMIVSMASTTPIEAIANIGKTQEEKSRFWFQLYVQPDRDFTRELIHRIE